MIKNQKKIGICLQYILLAYTMTLFTTLPINNPELKHSNESLFVFINHDILRIKISPLHFQQLPLFDMNIFIDDNFL